MTARMIATPESSVPALAFRGDSLTDMPILPMSEVVSAYYLRIMAIDKPCVPTSPRSAIAALASKRSSERVARRQDALRTRAWPSSS